MVGRYAPIAAICGDTGAYPIYMSMIIMIIKFWQRACTLTDTKSIVADCMKEQNNLLNKGKICWLKLVKQHLKNLKLDFFYDNPEKLDTLALKNNVKGDFELYWFKQLWIDNKQGHNKLRMYRMYKKDCTRKLS